jgi:hypothetical protein
MGLYDWVDLHFPLLHQHSTKGHGRRQGDAHGCPVSQSRGVAQYGHLGRHNHDTLDCHSFRTSFYAVRSGQAWSHCWHWVGPSVPISPDIAQNRD